MEGFLDMLNLSQGVKDALRRGDVKEAFSQQFDETVPSDHPQYNLADARRDFVVGQMRRPQLYEDEPYGALLDQVAQDVSRNSFLVQPNDNFDPRGVAGFFDPSTLQLIFPRSDAEDFAARTQFDSPYDQAVASASNIYEEDADPEKRSRYYHPQRGAYMKPHETALELRDKSDMDVFMNIAPEVYQNVFYPEEQPGDTMVLANYGLSEGDRLEPLMDIDKTVASHEAIHRAFTLTGYPRRANLRKAWDQSGNSTEGWTEPAAAQDRLHGFEELATRLLTAAGANDTGFFSSAADAYSMAPQFGFSYDTREKADAKFWKDMLDYTDRSQGPSVLDTATDSFIFDKSALDSWVTPATELYYEGRIPEPYATEFANRYLSQD
jgi:hypothetical protein